MLWLFAGIFFLIAILYASVGFGGGSSYIALLSMGDLPIWDLRILALSCNLMVVSLNIVLAQRKRRIAWPAALVLCAVSVPMAFWGAQIHLPTMLFKKILALGLLLAAISLVYEARLRKHRLQSRGKPAKTKGILLGSGMLIGLVSGITGIGGGVFLSPLLYLLAPIADVYIPSLCSLFIWANSLSGLIGMFKQSLNTTSNPWYSIYASEYLWLFPAVLLGAMLGNRVQNLLFSKHAIRRATAILLAVAAIRLLLK